MEKETNWTGNPIVFRTYLEGCKTGDGKSPSRKYGKIKGVQQIESFEEASKHKRFGALMNEGFVDISFDSEELSQQFWDMAEKNNWKCLILENLKNGHMHSFWKDSKGRITKKSAKDAKLAVGLIADIHSGDTYIPLRIDDFDRFPPSFEPDQIDEVPDELLPVNTTIDLLNMVDGDGRDSAIFAYENILKSQVTDDWDAVKRIIRNVNDFIFKDPLSDADIERLTRDEVIPKTAKSGRNFVFTEFGDMLMNQYNIKRINNRLHIYDNGYYVSDPLCMEEAMLTLGGATLNSAKRTEVMKYLQIKNRKNLSTMSFDNMIAFNNGVYDLDTETLLPFSPDYLILNKIPWNYDSDAYDELTDKTLDKISLNNKEIRMLLEEMIGYCFYRSSKFRKSFILTGKGKNGKSTFLKMLQYALDKDSDENVSALDLGDLDERFLKVRLYGKLANIGDDISENDMRGTGISIFKKAVTGESFNVEFKGQDGFDMKSYATLIFAANTIPKFSGKGLQALKDRLIIIPFNARFSDSDADYNPNIERELRKPGAIQYLIKLGIEGLQRLIRNQKFTEPDEVKDQMDEFEADNDSILSWLNSLKDSDESPIKDVVDTYIVGRRFDDIYGEYQGYCIKEGIDTTPSRNFSKEICSKVDGLIKGRLNDAKRSVTYKWT